MARRNSEKAVVCVHAPCDVSSELENWTIISFGLSFLRDSLSPFLDLVIRPFRESKARWRPCSSARPALARGLRRKGRVLRHLRAQYCQRANRPPARSQYQ